MSIERVPGRRFCLYDAAALTVVMERMAEQAAALLADAEDPLLLGILRRGAPLAAMLAARLRQHHGLAVPRYEPEFKIELLRPQAPPRKDA